ncbi:MAG: FMN-binding protein [Bacteroidota bacterium]
MKRTSRTVNSIVLLLLLLSTGSAQVYLSKEKALSIYLGESFERKTLFLTDDQVAAIQSAAKAKVESKVVTYYAGRRGIGFFETRTIRTMPATIFIVLHRDGSVQAVEILAFYEPEDYLPPKRWLKTFDTKTIRDDLWLKRGVYNVSGATLSAHVITESVRKYLATYSIAINKERP